MLAIVTIQLKDATSQGVTRFAEELLQFGWHQHPLMPDTFVADFPASAAKEDIVCTVYSDVGMSFAASDAESWLGSITIAHRGSSVDLPSS